MDDGDRADGVAGTAAEVSLHVKEVIEAAERAAATSVEQARAEGERRVGAAKERAQELVDERKARISEISDDLLQQAEAIEARLAKLDGALSAALEDLRRELERLPDPPPVDEHAEDIEDLDEDIEGDVREPAFS